MTHGQKRCVHSMDIQFFHVPVALSFVMLIEKENKFFRQENAKPNVVYHLSSALSCFVLFCFVLFFCWGGGLSRKILMAFRYC